MANEIPFRTDVPTHRTVVPGVWSDVLNSWAASYKIIDEETTAQNVNIAAGLPMTQFGETLTAGRTPIIELNSSYGVTLLRNTPKPVGSGTISSSGGEIQISTGTTPGSSMELDSSEAGRYIPGYGAELGTAFRLPVLPTGNQFARWGGHGVDDNNAFFFGVDASGIYVGVKKNGTVTKYPQSGWNIDKLDGSGVSGIDLDLTKGYIFQILFTWYGYGQILFGIISQKNNKQEFFPCHSVVPEGETSIDSPNLYLFQCVDNGGDASDFTAYIGGRQYSVVGDYVPKFRFASEYRTEVSTSTSAVPLVSFRTKSAFLDRSVKVEGFEAKPVTEDVLIQIILDPTLTNEVWQTPTDHTASEVAVESDRSATAVTGGIVIWSEILEAGRKNAFGSRTGRRIDFDLPQDSIVTIAAKTLQNTGTITVNFRVQEEW